MAFVLIFCRSRLSIVGEVVGSIFIAFLMRFVFSFAETTEKGCLRVTDRKLIEEWAVESALVVATQSSAPSHLAESPPTLQDKWQIVRFWLSRSCARPTGFSADSAHSQTRASSRPRLRLTRVPGAALKPEEPAALHRALSSASLRLSFLAFSFFVIQKDTFCDPPPLTLVGEE
jgi:hypothetical protein